ncbi:kinase-like domain-containing protein [Naematelia encephala]|uniref:Serine/threonine-protein kinase n=1 Tax=Naematelia encephala TaxID=71784 RepID=A0A1Y2BAX1_9TREE|nr:kinase-like domain-containing protein [Naematelia encephala]
MTTSTAYKPLATGVPSAAATTTTAKKEKIVPPSPPLTIRDRERGWTYARVGFLGEGGFARVYEVVDQHGERRAVKVVAKESIRTKKNKTKLWAEIKLHQMLSHPNIVRFDDCFEDDENVYMVLELCDNGSLMDLLRRRKRYTEPEVRYILVQLIAACQYMHQTNVIHRDLKLGNLFLDGKMDVKVGDFGLAALIEKPGDRKKTICGTPNYIAPEVLFDTANGHSFEVDVWSVGVILYTLLIGKPPFQTKDVKAIYKRIKENRYEFPPDKQISDSARDLIMAILNPNPDKRPTLEAILAHTFFHDGPFPPLIPATANDEAPNFSHLTRHQSRKNFEAACARAKVGVPLPINTDNTRLRTALGPSIIQQERDFKNAVQPDSPISALLSSARQPLVQAPNQIKEPSLLRKLTAAGAQSTLSPVRRGLGKENAGVGPSSRRPMAQVREEEEIEEIDEEEKPGYDAAVRDRELATQKARIVSQMAEAKDKPARVDSPRKAPLSAATTVSRGVSSYPGRDHDPQAASMKAKDGRTSLFETFGQNLATALAAAQTAAGFSSPHVPLQPAAPRVFVVSWLDYCVKYGMGFAMTDGTVCVHFNDTSSVALAPGKQFFDYIQPAAQGDLLQGVRKNYPVDDYPRELNNKVYLLRHFESYMLDRLFGDQPYTFEDEGLTKGMVFVTRYLRMKHVILFRLSNDVLQFNFYDHTKLILSEDGYVVSIIDKHYALHTWSLQVLLRPLSDDVPSKERRRIEGVIHKVQYAKDVLTKIRDHAMPANKPKVTPTTITTEREVAKPIR